MENWFTIEMIDQNTFAISEYRHWEETHCYLLLGENRAALIDTGLGISNIKNIVTRLTSLPILVLTTHAHWDHIGGHGLFEDIAVHDAEREWLSGNFPLPLDVVKQNLTCRPCEFPQGFQLDHYHVFQGGAAIFLHDGACVELGGRQVKTIHTPGHSPGHCCFYEPDRKYLYTGDLIYKGCLDAFYPTTDPQLFFRSIQKVRALEIHKVLPAHHQLNIPVSMIGQIEAAFHKLSLEGNLVQGNGIFEFGDFQIHI